jgi:bacteriorhodopsin
MNGRRTLALVLVLALICIAGIVGMLLSDSALDWLFFAMTAAPLLIGAWRWRASRADEMPQRPKSTR